MEGNLGQVLKHVGRPVAAADKNFWRCPTCLEVWCMEFRPANLPDGFRCPVCDHGGQLDYMGEHKWGDSLVKEEINCACNENCQSARGPLCSCRCGGENHGLSHYIVVEKAAGSVPKLPAGINRARAQARRDEFLGLYRQVRSELDRRRDPLMERKRRREFLPAGDFRALLELNRQAADLENKVCDCKVHATRMKKLGRMAEGLGIRTAPAAPVVEHVRHEGMECTGRRPAAGGWLF